MLFRSKALVMELVPGPTLDERGARGSIPLEEGLPVREQLVDALEYGHDASVIHRELKPANIKVTPEGRVKVLDLGLAKLPDPVTPATVPRPIPSPWSRRIW